MSEPPCDLGRKNPVKSSRSVNNLVKQEAKHSYAMGETGRRTHVTALIGRRHCYYPNASILQLRTFIIFVLPAIQLLCDQPINHSALLVEGTSINYGISQQPITDINQLMPKLCQNQSVICEGIMCIEKVKRCVCDLRMPVQFGRFCLRQVDIETKCFVTNQCNHTIKDAVCLDTNTNTVLDLEASRFKLEQWQQLDELRQMSQSALSSDVQQTTTVATYDAPGRQKPSSPSPFFLLSSSELDDFPSFETRDDVIQSNFRNSPYEINYTNEQYIEQNHTRKRTNKNINNNRLFDPLNFIPTSTPTTARPTTSNLKGEVLSDERLYTVVPAPSTTSATEASAVATGSSTTEISIVNRINSFISSQINPSHSTTPREDRRNEPTELTISEAAPLTTTTSTTTTTTIATTTAGEQTVAKKKITVQAPTWPPGVCLCPRGFMFDSMLRKCLALSLADSHCQTDNDCKQISRTHCSSETKKCECIEPLVWNQTDLACVKARPVPIVASDNNYNNKLYNGPSTTKDSFFENLLPPLLLAKLLPDQTVLLIIFAIVVVIGTLVILKLTVKCFSSRSSALISPKHNHQKGRKSQANSNSSSLPPRSPYATLKRPEYKAKSQLSNFTQATRGRILNYDFEQDAPIVCEGPQQQPQQHQHQQRAKSTTPLPPGEKELGQPTAGLGGTLRGIGKAHNHNHHHHHHHHQQPAPSSSKDNDQLYELKDNVSLNGQLDSESKSDNSALAIPPGPPPTQPPPYMLASAMRGQGSAIAAAAAAVANRRMQMAQKKNHTEQQNCSGRESPVFL